MAALCASDKTPPRDKNPLCRSLSRTTDLEAQTNENMCFALWELMSRS
jgi:hypothetical protein